jgi:2-aminobenzoate-CoA ligase
LNTSSPPRSNREAWRAQPSPAAVVPRSDADGFNSVVAFVVLASKEAGDATAEELKAHLSAMLPPYKCPSEFRFAEGMPRTATGKLQRFKLREELSGARDVRP